MAHSKNTIETATKKQLLTVEQYAATRTGWRGKGCNPSYIYKLITEYNKGLKTTQQIGFKPIEKDKSWLIEVI